MHKNVVVTIGEVVVDWISTDLGPGITEAENFIRCLGGNAANVALGVARLGGQARLVGKVGRDFHGDFLQTELRESDINLEFLSIDSKAPTAQCYCVRDSNEEVRYYSWPRPNAADMLNVDDITYDVISGAVIIHATGISLAMETRRSAVMKALELAKKESVIVSFDATFPDSSDLPAMSDARTALALSDLIKVNLEELLFWTGATEKNKSITSRLREYNFALKHPKLSDLRELIHSFVETYKPAILFLTLSADGSFAVFGEHEVYCRPYSVSPYASSIGAGDAFISGILSGLTRYGVDGQKSLSALTKDDWYELALFANAVGALSIRSVGAIESLPTMSEVKELRASI